MNAPPPLVYLIHNVAARHYRQHHRDPDPDHAETFADTFVGKLFSSAAQAEAGRALWRLWIFRTCRGFRPALMSITS
jgi:hypothetical protein